MKRHKISTSNLIEISQEKCALLVTLSRRAKYILIRLVKCPHILFRQKHIKILEPECVILVFYLSKRYKTFFEKKNKTRKMWALIIIKTGNSLLVMYTFRLPLNYTYYFFDHAPESSCVNFLSTKIPPN